MTISRRTNPPRLAALAALAIIAAFAAFAALAGARSDAAGLPRLATQEPPHELQVKPPLVLYTGDGTGFVSGSDPSPSASRGGIEWEEWSTSSALGHGFNYVNDCRPDCADGTFHKYAATIEARSPKGGNFTRMTIEYQVAGKTTYDHRILERAGGLYYWGICGAKFTDPC